VAEYLEATESLQAFIDVEKGLPRVTRPRALSRIELSETLVIRETASPGLEVLNSLSSEKDPLASSSSSTEESEDETEVPVDDEEEEYEDEEDEEEWDGFRFEVSWGSFSADG
jgi:hypothetical protein